MQGPLVGDGTVRPAAHGVGKGPEHPTGPPRGAARAGDPSRGPLHGGLGDAGAHHGHPEDVRLELEQGLVHRHAAVHAQRLDPPARVRGERLEQVPTLVGRGLDGGARQVPAPGVARQPRDDPARVRPPVRRVEPGEGGDDDDDGLRCADAHDPSGPG
ncbi:hypothetical protein GCM10022241_08290 [Micrococcus endophyticus]